MATEGNPKAENPYAGTALGGLFIGIVAICGVAALVIGWPSMRQAREAHGWPTVEGTVIRSGMSSSVVPDSADMYRPEIVYAYEVNGTAYRGSRLSFAMDASYSRSEVEEDVARYRPGQKVSVHYAPGEPTRACLEPGPWYAGVSRVVTGAALLLITGILLSIRLARTRQARPRGR
jgi:hypothetical protein